MVKRSSHAASRGPKPDRLKIDGDWESAMKRAVEIKPAPKKKVAKAKKKPGRK